jgi:EAL domain-containing protein (putative c-di-GMP-specific phosphodiesterase class I)
VINYALIALSGAASSVTTRLPPENDLRRALRNRKFVLHYQAIAALRSEQIVGFEAVIRWQVPGRGLVYPGDFIPMAEETGIIVPLGCGVLREACNRAVSTLGKEVTFKFYVLPTDL